MLVASPLHRSFIPSVPQAPKSYPVAQPLLAKDSFAISANKQSGLAFLSDYSNVKALMFQTKKAADLPELKGFQLTAQDLERNPLILRNIQKGLAERLMLEAFKVDALNTMPLKDRRELSSSLRYIALACRKEAIHFPS